ncbi:MAG: ATP-dependent chaperone ClpB, partial [Planctomycetaceae bacterium]|nr:ATP-dependent chaperone ClpB [Planctomycetaceae bacterium]
MAFRPDKLTVKSQEALQGAQQLAESKGNPQVVPVHLLKALIAEPDGIPRAILQKVGANATQLEKMVDGEIDRLPKASGAATQVSPSRDFMTVLEKSQELADQLHDQFVSTEHLLSALTQVKDTAQRLLEINGIEQQDILTALKSVRGGQSVTDQNPEDKYQALQKYGKDLVEMARKGKIDPVIGRDAEIRRVVQVLARRRKNNPVLIGEPGV